MKNLKFIIVLSLLAIFPFESSIASTFENDDRVHITNLHRIDDDLYTFCNNLNVDGQIDGDLLAFAGVVEIGGKIGGSINAFTRSFTFNGATKRSVRTFAEDIKISGYIHHSLVAAGSFVSLTQSADIQRDVNLYGNEISVNGHIGQDLVIRGSKVYISGLIEGNVDIKADKIIISAPAVINGDLTFSCENEAEIDYDNGVIIGGEVIWKDEGMVADDYADDNDVAELIIITKAIGAFIFGIIMLYMFRRYALGSLNELKERFAKSFAVGILTVMIMLFAWLILIISFICFIAGSFMLSGENAMGGAVMMIISILLLPITSFMSVSGFILLYSGFLIVAILIGNYIVNKFKKNAAPIGKSQMFFGIVIITIMMSIPYFGIIATIVFSLAGAGAIVLGIRSCNRGNMIESDIKPPEPDLPTPPPTDSGIVRT